jgi:transposase
MWLARRLAPDFKTIADFRRDNGPAIRRVCAQFVARCKKLMSIGAPNHSFGVESSRAIGL